MESSQSRQGVWSTANEIGGGGAVDESSQSHLLTNENRHLLVQYFASRTSSSGQRRQRHASYHGDLEDLHYHDEGITRHMDDPSVTSSNRQVTNSSHNDGQHVTNANHMHHDNYHVVRRHYSRSHSIGRYDDGGYYGNSELQPHHRYGHYKSCNVIGSTSHDPSHLSQSRSVHNIQSSSTNPAAHLTSSRATAAAVAHTNRLTKCSSSLAVHSSGIEYICNFTSPHKVINSQSRSGGQSRSAQDLRRVSWYGDHQQSITIATANDTPTKKKSKRHKKCVIM